MTALSDLSGTHWSGTAELWADPLGDEASRSDCTLAVEGSGVRYTWSRDGTAHAGSVTLREHGADFVDSWHQAEGPMQCRRLSDALGLFQVEGSYGPEGEWRWRIALCHRAPTDELVLQMTNIAPWGEEARAVRMTCRRVD